MLFPDEPSVEELAQPHAAEAAEAVESSALVAEAEESATEERWDELDVALQEVTIEQGEIDIIFVKK